MSVSLSGPYWVRFNGQTIYNGQINYKVLQFIMNYNNIEPKEWENSILFDDAMSNLSMASVFSNLAEDGTDIKTCQASPNCGGEYCDTGCGLPRGCLNLI